MQNKKTQTFNTKSFLIRCLYHWPLFVIVTVVFFTGAFFYLKKAQPVYEVKATLMVNTDQKDANTELTVARNIKPSPVIVENEIDVLKSKQLIDKVVNKLGLWASYSTKDKSAVRDLYKDSPVKITVTSPERLDKNEVDIIVKDGSNFLLVDENGKSSPKAFSKLYYDSFGTWMLTATPNLQRYKGALIKIKLTNPNAASLGYQKALDVSLSNKLSTNLLLSLPEQNADRGKDFINQLITYYQDDQVSQKQQLSLKEWQLVTQKMDTASAKLAEQRNAIQKYKSSHNINNVESETNDLVNEERENKLKLNDVELQLGSTETIERRLASGRSQDFGLSAVNLHDDALNSLFKTLSDLLLERDQKLSVYPETNPNVEAVDQKIATIKASIKSSLATYKQSLRSEQSLRSDRESKLLAQISERPVESNELGAKVMDQERQEQMYSQMKETQLAKNLTANSTLSNSRVVDAAYAGTPKVTMPIVVYGGLFFFAIAFCAGLVYVRSLISGRVNSLDQIREVISLPVISELPYNRSKNPIAIGANTVTPLTEQLRALRTKMYQNYITQGKGRVTLITSSLPEEGKSFVSSNLGVAMALANRRTVILELDLRKPKISKIFGLSKKHPGIGDLLNGSADELQVVQQVGAVPNLHVVSCGAVSNNPAELLDKKELKDLINSLRENYDEILLDTAPVHLVPDAMILAPLADQTLYILRQGATKKSELNFIKELSDQRLLPNMRLIFNGIESNKYGYGYNYVKPYYNDEGQNSFFNLVFSDFPSRF